MGIFEAHAGNAALMPAYGPIAALMHGFIDDSENREPR